MTKKSRKKRKRRRRRKTRRRSRRGGQNTPLEIKLDPLRQRAHSDVTSVSNPKMQHVAIDKQTMEEMHPNDSAFNKWADWGCPSKDYSDQGSKGFCWMISTMILLLNLKIPLNQKVNSFLEKLENQFNSGKLEENCAIYPRWLKKWYDPHLTAEKEGGLSSPFVRALLQASGYFVFYGVKMWWKREGRYGISAYYKNPSKSSYENFCGGPWDGDWELYRLPSIPIASTLISIHEDMSNKHRPDLERKIRKKFDAVKDGDDAIRADPKLWEVNGRKMEKAIFDVLADENLKNMKCWKQGEDWLKWRKKLHEPGDADKYTIFMIEYAGAVENYPPRKVDYWSPNWNISPSEKIDIQDFKEFLQNAPEKVRGGGISCKQELYSFKTEEEMRGNELEAWRDWSFAVIEFINNKDKSFFKNKREYQIIQKIPRDDGIMVKQGGGAWVEYIEEEDTIGTLRVIDKGHNYTKGPWEIEWQPRGPVPRVRHKLGGLGGWDGEIVNGLKGFESGTAVEVKGRVRGSTTWYPGVIKRVHIDGFFDVDTPGNTFKRLSFNQVWKRRNVDGWQKSDRHGATPPPNLDLDSKTLQTNTSGHVISFFRCGNEIFYCNSWGNPCNDIDKILREYKNRPNRWTIRSFYILIFQPPSLALQLGRENEAAAMVLKRRKKKRYTRKNRLQAAAQRRGLYTRLWSHRAAAEAPRLLRPRGRGRVAHGLGDIGSLPFSPQTLGMTKVLAERHVRYPVGKLVEAQVGRKWYPARVTKISGGKYTVQYEDEINFPGNQNLYNERMENQLRASF